MNRIDLPTAANGHGYVFIFDDESLLELAEVCQEKVVAEELTTEQAIMVIEAADFAIRLNAMEDAVALRRGLNMEALKGK